MALLSGHRSVAEVTDLGLEVSGDAAVLRRVLPDSPAFAVHSPDPHLPNGSRPSPTHPPGHAGSLTRLLSGQEGARRMTTITDTGSLGTFPGRDGLALAYRSVGDGRPLVLLHGFTGSARLFLQGGLPAALAANGYRVIVPDLRGHGDSARPHDPAAYPPDVLADDGLALVDFLQLRDYDLGGYSLGAKVVLRMLARGARPARAIIAGQGLDALDGSTSRTGGYRRMLAAIARGDHLEPGSPEAMQADWLAQSGADPQALLHVLDTSVETPGTALAAITTPTLVVAGEEDERQAAELAAALPAARYVPVPGNHLTALLGPELPAAILAFLGDHAAGAAR
jgi:pimeloyl-ACP methyl ester carboxylesterase